MKLNARQIDTAKPKEKAYKLADGGGLYLLVKPNGGKYWRLKYRVNGYSGEPRDHMNAEQLEHLS
ncbi:DUF4102 domain-containing protein, partial [Escherichia coli]|nr:DUF4102 domain-containing protein [Escherichia coli]